MVVFQHDFHGQHLPQVKEKLFLKGIICLKGRSYLRSHPLSPNRMKQILWCSNEANELYLSRRLNLSSESIEPNDNDLELNVIAYTFSKVFQPELKQLFAQPH